MRLIFSNKSVALAAIFLSTGYQVFGQVDLSRNKQDTKRFLKELVRLYKSDLKKIQVKNTSTVLAVAAREKHDHRTFAVDISLENDTKIKFDNPQVDSLVAAYTGPSENLRQLFKNIESDTPIPVTYRDAIKNRYLVPPLNVTLFGTPGFIERYYNRQWRTYRRPDRLSLSVFGGVNFSTAFVTPFQYSDETELKTQIRRTNEGYLPGGIFGFSAGYSRYSHGVDFFFQHTNYGCKYFQDNQIDWKTGFYGVNAIATDSSKFSIPVNQFGIRYRYSNYFRKISPYTSVGIHLSYVNKSSRDLMELNSRYLSTGFNLALGLNIHPIYALDIHIAPVMNVSFNGIKKSELQTRFSSIALEVGVQYNITFIKGKYKTR